MSWFAVARERSCPSHGDNDEFMQFGPFGRSFSACISDNGKAGWDVAENLRV